MSEITIEEEEFNDALNVILSRFFMWFLMFEKYRWKGIQSEKELMSWFPGLNFSSKTKKEG